MDERRAGAISYGYGLRWTEPKAKGWARFFQLFREPATKTTAPLVFVATLTLYFLAMSGVYALVHSEYLSNDIRTTDTKGNQEIPVSGTLPGHVESGAEPART
jgi:hypothetical protein